VPKDGPSAGVTLFTALSSLLTGRIVDPHIAMTGEVALRGAVTPIGGLPEKLMAAQRAGVKKVLIPKDNGFRRPENKSGLPLRAQLRLCTGFPFGAATAAHRDLAAKIVKRWFTANQR